MATHITTQQNEGLASSLTEYAARRTATLTAYAAEGSDSDTDTDVAPASAWSGVIGMEQELTGDGRLIVEGALEWATPIPLRFVLEDVGGHNGAITVGRILSIERKDDGRIAASGDFDLGSDAGREAARLVNAEVLNGVSIDLDSVAFEVRVASELYDDLNSVDPVPEDEADAEPDEEPELETDEEGRVIIAKMNANDELMVITAARVRGATLVSIPAFADAKIYAAEEAAQEADGDAALVASAAPIEPPLAWFNRPETEGPTALTITDEGQVYGHLATWDTCHIADPSGSGVCVMAPKSKSNYSYFHTGAVKSKEGDFVPTGSIRFNTGHASMRSNASDAAAHYDNTGLAGADVHAINGKFGVWVAGALRPGVTAEQIRTLRASPLSGDWRYVDGNLELVGALAVNLPGFPIPRTQGMVASGAMTAIVAAGMVAPEAAQAVKQFSDSDAAYLQRLVDRERLHEQRTLAARVQSAQRRRKISALAAERRVKTAIEGA